MAYTATIVKIEEIRPHSNADNLNLTTIHGNQVIIGKDTQVGDIGVFFPEGGQLSPDFVHFNNLYSDPPKNLDRNVKGYFDSNRRVRALSFRGEKSEGFWLPISCLYYIQAVLYPEDLEVGRDFDHIGNILICNKYVTPVTISARGDKGVKHRAAESLMFPQHFDTNAFGKNSHKFQEGDVAYITTKLYGTSQRVGNILMEKKLTWKEKIATKIASWFGIEIVKKEWTFVIGTRRVTLNSKKQKGFRELAAQPFMDKLHKGELVYYEVVGYDNQVPVMGSHSNSKLANFLSKKDYEEFIKFYGDKTIFSYNCSPGELDVYVYRIAHINEDGVIIDLPWDSVVSRCEELGVKTVPYVACLIVDKDFVNEIKELNIPYSSDFPEHLSEGICIRRDDYPTPLILKEKTFEFKVLEGIIKDNQSYVDKEEVEDES
jgi:hypothetical protein